MRDFYGSEREEGGVVPLVMITVATSELANWCRRHARWGSELAVVVKSFNSYVNCDAHRVIHSYTIIL